MNDIFHNSAAFTPFFGDVITVEGRRRFSDGTRPVSGTFGACVLDNGYADPVSDMDGDSDIRVFGVSVKAGDWVDGTRPQVGDRITLQGGLRLAVSHVDLCTGDMWSMTAREVR